MAFHEAGKRATGKHYPFGHFDSYAGERFEKAVADQVTFLLKAFAAKR